MIFSHPTYQHPAGYLMLSLCQGMRSSEPRETLSPNLVVGQTSFKSALYYPSLYTLLCGMDRRKHLPMAAK